MSRKQEQMETLLLLLRDSKDYISAKVLGEKLNCSDKTVYRLVKVINKDCPVEAFILSEKGRGFKLNPRSSLVDVDGNFTEAFDPEVRREKLLERLLLTAPKPHSIYDLGEEFYVSESVVLKDRQILQESLAIYGLDLKMRQRKLFIDGDEAQIRSAILNLLPMFNQLDLEQITQNKVQPLDGELAHFCLGLLITLERELGVNIPYPYNINIFSHLYIFISRNRRSTSIHVVAPSKPTIVDEKIYSVCTKIIQEIEQYFKMKVDAVEIDYLYQYVVSSRLQKPFSSGKLPFSQRVLDVTHYYFSRMCMDNREIETTDPDFVDLASHISPLLRRLDNRVQIKNSLLSQILLTYPNLVKELTTISKEVSLVFGFASLSLDEIGFLVLYFARFQEKRARPLKTVVMCTSGVGTSELLRARLEKQFSELDIIDVVAYHQLDELINLYPDLDFIVTTVALQEPASVPFVLVSAFLTEGDKQRLQAKIQEINYE